MIDFLKKIVSLIVEDQEKLQIVEKPENNLVVYTILVPETEIGKVIGKKGKVINAIRTLARLKAFKEGKRVLVKIDKLSN